MELIDFRRPANGFANALQLWLACHDRFERVVALVERLTQHVGDHGPDDSARLTAGEVRRYFDQAAPRHHEDEDIDIFPLVLRRAREARLDGETDAAARTIERLSSDHRALDAQWPRLRDMLDGIELQQPMAIDSALVGQFVHSQLTHHRAEDQVICPLAQRLLTPEDLGLLGTVMAARRGLSWSELAAAARNST
jgi:iron-sulfur cluster repair protein YtfE (RIC family)